MKLLFGDTRLEYLHRPQGREGVAVSKQEANHSEVGQCGLRLLVRRPRPGPISSRLGNAFKTKALN